jgi:hypothetical protein
VSCGPFARATYRWPRARVSRTDAQVFELGYAARPNFWPTKTCTVLHVCRGVWADDPGQSVATRTLRQAQITGAAAPAPASAIDGACESARCPPTEPSISKSTKGLRPAPVMCRAAWRVEPQALDQGLARFEKHAIIPRRQQENLLGQETEPSHRGI